MLDPCRSLKTAGVQKGSKSGIERKRPVAAPAERKRQAALNAPSGEAREKKGEASKRARRQAGQDIVFREPARAAIALDQEMPLLSVEGTEVSAVSGRDV